MNELRDKIIDALNAELQKDELFDAVYKLVVESRLDEIMKLKNFDMENNYTDSSTTYYWKMRESELQSQLSSIGGKDSE